MKHSANIILGARLRLRLFRRVLSRTWRSVILGRAKFLIQSVDHETSQTAQLSTPAIFLSSFETPLDFWVLSYLFQEKELTFLSPRQLPADKVLKQIKRVNRVLYLDEKVNFRFLRELLTTLRDFNRSVVISPQAAEKYASRIPIDPVIVIRIAMSATVPIIPIVISWNGKKCRIWVGPKIYISPQSEEFKDIFFKQRGVRKYRDLPAEDLVTIGSRIFSKLKRSETY